MKVHKLLHATQIKEHIHSYKYTNIHEHLVHLFNLCQGERKQQQQDGDDNVVGIFTSKVRHLGNTVHQL